MNYTVITLGDPSRKHYVDKIDKTLAKPWSRFHVMAVNGNEQTELDYYLEAWGVDVNFPSAQKGHLGIWCSVMVCLKMLLDSGIDRIVTFEDDALLNNDFVWEWEVRSKSIPADVDFFSLFLPRDQDKVYYGDVERYRVNDHVCKAYQRYGGVSMMYTKKGAQKIMDLLKQEGITGQYDDSLYMWAKAGLLNGYTSPPNLSDLVYITGEEPSIVQNTDLYTGV